jgi:hypothetical protein
MLTTDNLIEEWIETRGRIAEHIAVLRTGPKIHLIGDRVAEVTRTSLEMLLTWQTAIDEAVIELLPQPDENDPT